MKPVAFLLFCVLSAYTSPLYAQETGVNVHNKILLRLDGRTEGEISKLSQWTRIPSPKFESIKELILDRNIQRIEDLLPLIPESYRMSYTLVYRSRSLHEASPLYPRVILFGGDGKLILSFNGHSSQRNYDKLEIMQFRDETRTFDFIEIQFPEIDPKSISGGTSNKVKFRTNPENCLRCHGPTGRPIMDSYPFWPGFYGSIDDHLVAPGERHPFSKESPYFILESENYSKFLATSRKSGRYRWLGNDERNSTFPFGNRDPFLVSEDMSDRPNFRLNRLLAILNGARVANLVSKQTRFERLTRKIDLGPRSSRSQENDSSYRRSVMNLYSNALEADFFFRRSHTMIDPGEYPDIDAFGPRDRLEYRHVVIPRVDNGLRFMSSVGVSPHELLLPLELNSSLNSAGNATVFDFLEHFVNERINGSESPSWIDELEKDLPEINFDRGYIASYVQRFRAIQNLPAPTVRDRIKNCASCHTGKERIALEIPFDSRKQLSDALNQGNLLNNIVSRMTRNFSGRMPLNEKLEPAEATEFINYLRKLRDSGNFH